jgi:NAD+ synthase (glutamine-hydrolysing)
MRRVRVALAQVNPTVGAIEANARMVIDWMGRARAAGADLVAFPELVLTGYPPEDLVFKPSFIEANLRALADVAAQSQGLTAVVGFVDKRDDIFNAAAVLHDGVPVGTYHKQYLPNYGCRREPHLGHREPHLHPDRWSCHQHLRGHSIHRSHHRAGPRGR